MRESGRQSRKRRGQLPGWPWLALLALAIGIGLAGRDMLLEPPAGNTGEPANPPPTRARPAPSEADLAAARNELAAARSACQAFDFEAAGRLADRAAIRAEGSETARKAQELAQRASVFRALLEGVEKAPRAAARTYALEFDTDTIEVAIEREDERHYYVVVDGNLHATVAKADVRAVRQVPEDERRQRLLAELAGLKARQASHGALGLFLAAEFAYRNGLTDEVLPLLEAAYDQNQRLLDEVCDYRAALLLYRAMWRQALSQHEEAVRLLSELLVKHPTSRHAPTARTMLASMSPEAPAAPDSPPTLHIKRPRTSEGVTSRPAVAPTPLETAGGFEADSALDRAVGLSPTVERLEVPDAAAQALANEADGFYQQALEHYLAGQPGQPNFAAQLRKAADLFEKAMQLYAQALQVAPEHKPLQARASEAARLHDSTIRMLPINTP